MRKKIKKKTFHNRYAIHSSFKAWWFGLKEFRKSIFRVAAASQLLIMLTTILILGYFIAAIYTGSGEFIMSVDRPLANEGFYISNSTDFSEKLNTLTGKAVEEVDNISIFDLPKDVFEVEGPHNGRDYIAHTFYLTNKGKDMATYQYQLQVRSETKHIGNAIWVMVAQNGVMKTYARLGSDKLPEAQFSSLTFPFQEYMEESDASISTISNDNPRDITQSVITYHGWESLDGISRLEATPFLTDTIVCQDVREEFPIDGVDRYTVVIWLEGEDPECVNELLGGEIEMAMKFSK